MSTWTTEDRIEAQKMSAYELADDAKNISNTIEALEFVQKAVPMLRQQADRIAELEKVIQDGIKAFGGIQDQQLKDKFEKPQTYTLTDSEIQQISYRYHYTYNPDYVGFARAIEAKVRGDK